MSRCLAHDKNQLEAQAILVALVIFRTLFRLGEDEYILEFEQCGGLDNLEQLQYSDHKPIYDAAVDMIEKYFNGEELDDDAN